MDDEIKVGDIIYLMAPNFKKGLRVKVMEINPDDGRIVKIKAIRKNPKLLRMGFYEEGDSYVAKEHNFCRN